MAGCILWESYGSLSRLAKEEPATQVKVFNVAFVKRDSIYYAKPRPHQGLAKGTAKHNITAMHAYVDGHMNETVELCNFRCHKQQ